MSNQDGQESPSSTPVLHAGKQTPHLLDEAFSWHERYLRTGNMHEKVEHTR